MANQSRYPLLMIGLDALDSELVGRWAREGALPGFARLDRQAAQGALSSPTGVMQGSIWPSFTTGLDPSGHGLYFMSQLTPDYAGLRRMQAADLRVPPFWNRPGSAVGPVAVVDVPKQQLAARSGDVQVVEWGALDHFSRFATEPPAFAAELLHRFGRHPLLQPLKAPLTPLGRARLRRRLLRGVQSKDALNRQLLERHRPRMLLSVFGEAHAAGHYLWPRDRGGDAEPPRPEADGALGAVYRGLDRMLSRLVADYAHRANLIIFSGHGMLADHVPAGVIETLLERLGLLVPAVVDQGPVGAKARLALLGSRLPYDLRRLANEYLLPAGLQRRLMGLKGLSRIDLQASRAFTLPSDHQGFIRINLAGREPRGQVAPDQYEALCDRIETELMQLTDAATGAPLVDHLVRTRACFGRRAYSDALPDLCVVWTERPRAPTLVHSAQGPISAHRRHPERTGNHRLRGFYYAVGPDIDTGVRDLDANLLDLAPTAMRLLNGRVPEGLDGRVLPILRARDQVAQPPAALAAFCSPYNK